MVDRPIHILLVDDDAEYVDVVKHHVQAFPGKTFTITCVTDGEKALRSLASGSPVDLVLMDYYLPSSNGIEIAKSIHEAHPGIPVILLTSNKDFRIAVEAMKFGVEEYLVKEEMIDTMLPRTIVNVLDRLALKRRIDEIEKAKLVNRNKDEAVQQLVVTLCHEFNNPLAAIKISADIMMRQKLGEPERELLSRLNIDIGQIERQIVKLRDLGNEKKL